MRRSFLLCFVLLAAPVVYGQEDTNKEEDCKVESLDFLEAGTEETATHDEGWTETEQMVADLVKQEGVHVVRFWAPWCHNSMSELREGWWDDLIRANADVSFTFVTVFNDGEVDASTLTSNGIPSNVTMLAQPEKEPKSQRRLFMDYPIHWTPSTWIFHRDGERAFALNYGELDQSTLQHMLDLVKKDWSHD